MSSTQKDKQVTGAEATEDKDLIEQAQEAYEENQEDIDAGIGGGLGALGYGDEEEEVKEDE